MTGHVNQPALLEFSQQVPIVATGHNINTERVRTFSINNRLGGYRQRVIYWIWAIAKLHTLFDLPDQNDAIERQRGYRQALVSSGIEYDPELVVQGDFAEAGGFNAAKQLVASGKSFRQFFVPMTKPAMVQFWG